MRELIDMPAEIARLPCDHRGYPVPEFVYWCDGQPDFRIVQPGWREECYRHNRCWLCGGQLGKRKWFVLGPMCSVTRTTMEPPSHRLCAEFAVKNCPFLTKPLAKRNERGMEDAYTPGLAIDRNPGVTMVWETLSYKPFNVENGWLITVGDPLCVTAWREGRHATRQELEESVLSGLPAIKKEAVREGQDALRALALTLGDWKLQVFDRWFPEEKEEEDGQRNRRASS